MLIRFLKNSQVRLLFSGTLFTVAFVWMAITSYDVDKAEIRVFLILSLIFVGGIMVCGLLFSVILTFFRRDKLGMLSRFDDKKKTKSEAHDKEQE